MVSTGKRQLASGLIKKFLSSEITNDDFRCGFPSDEGDPALAAISDNLWPHYSDTCKHKLEGKHALGPEAKELFLRCALFLESGLEYEWPSHRFISFRYLLMRLIGRRQKLEEGWEAFTRQGDFDVWPFIRRADYEKFSAGR